MEYIAPPLFNKESNMGFPMQQKKGKRPSPKGPMGPKGPKKKC